MPQVPPEQQVVPRLDAFPGTWKLWPAKPVSSPKAQPYLQQASEPLASSEKQELLHPSLFRQCFLALPLFWVYSLSFLG